MILKKYKKFILIADQMLFSGLAFVITIILSRLYSLELFGLFASLIIFLYLILSISQAIIIQPMQIMSNKTNKIKDYKTFLLLCLLAFLCLIFLTGLTSYLLDITFIKSFKPYILSFTIYAIVFILHDFFRKWFLSVDDILSTFIIDSTAATGQIIALCIAFLIFEGGISILLLCFAASYIPSICLAFFKFHKGLSFNRFKEFVNYHVSEGKWFLLTAITQWCTNNLFVISSGFFIGLEALGALRLGQSIFGILNILLQTAENYIIPSVNRLYLKSKQESIYFLQSLSKKSIFPISIILASIFVFSKPSMGIVGGQDFAPYHIVLKGLSLLYLIIIAAYPVRISIRILELNRVFFLAYLVAFAAGLLSFQLLLKHFQLSGALAGLIINQIIMICIWQSTLTRKKFKIWKSYISY